MKMGYIGNAYPVTGCKPDKNFRLKSYNKEKILTTVKSNLECLRTTLQFNQEHKLFFYRIADFIPFASHPISIPLIKMVDFFQNELEEIGYFIQKHDFRISMHPGQYTVINSPKEEVVNNSIQEILYNCLVLDRMGLDSTAKIQIHVGGIYGDKLSAIERFIQTYLSLSKNIRKRLVIENDNRLFDLQDCLAIHNETKIPVVFDVFHHEMKNNQESILEAIKLAEKTWMKSKDGILMLDWSSQQPEAKIGKHADHIDLRKFEIFLNETKGLNFDIMLEIRDKVRSALKAIKLIQNLEKT
jgi:UV DNA damage endonuclease